MEDRDNPKEFLQLVLERCRSEKDCFVRVRNNSSHCRTSLILARPVISQSVGFVRDDQIPLSQQASLPPNEVFV